jgi:GH25 family lysozyme M1 (1,4-beta-N-acetylmuramidase)
MSSLFERGLLGILCRTGSCFLACCAAAISGDIAQAQFIYGVDVSHYQGSINWTSAKNAGTVFAFAKATEGVDFIDDTFTMNMTNARAAGVYIAPYHYARVDSFEGPTDATSEANDFVDAIQQYYQTPGYVLRPALDLEEVPNDGRAIKPYESQWVRDFMGVVQSRLGVTPIIYTNTNYATNYLESNISQYDLWLANWNYAPPSVPPSSADGIFNGWKFWQYTSSGSVAGIPGNVDRDVYRGTLAEMLAEFQGVKPTGDINSDGKVDGADFVKWQRNLGRTGASATFANGSANGDSTINAADLAVIESQFATAGALSSASAVPEPGAGALFWMAIIGAMRRRRAG